MIYIDNYNLKHLNHFSLIARKYDLPLLRNILLG